MKTDWNTLRNNRADNDLSDPDETGPARLIELLTAAGYNAEEKDGLVLLTGAAAAPATLVALVSASELFAWDDEQERRLKHQLDVRKVGRMRGMVDLFMEKVWVWQSEHKHLRGPHTYLYVVDLDDWLANAEHRDLAELVEQDVQGVRKFVLSADDLPSRLANPFGSTYAGEKLPTFEVQKMDRHPLDPPVREWTGTVTHVFQREREPFVWLERLYAHGNAGQLTALAAQLVRRVMGPAFELVPDTDEVMLKRGREPISLPWYCLSSSEQQGLAFCAYLALATEVASPDKWLGITDALSSLDLSHYMLALDVVRDLVIATGVNVYLKTNQGDYQGLARCKLEAANDHLKVRAA